MLSSYHVMAPSDHFRAANTRLSNGVPAAFQKSAFAALHPRPELEEA
jgi:hypothetical protein